MVALLEICAGSLTSALAAEAGGAARIELCQGLELGGLTPSAGLLHAVRARVALPVLVLLRPRPGHFVYTADEYAVLQTDLTVALNHGADGVVLGLLTPDHRVDVARTRALVARAGQRPVTFHRAFDECDDLAQALEDVIATGCQRLLTSGGEPTAVEGAATLQKLVRQAAGRICIVPGAGLTPANIAGVAATTGATEFHASARRRVRGNLPAHLPVFATPVLETDAATVAALVAALE